MQWFKFHADFATDSRVQRLSETDRCRLVQLMCLQCSEQFFDLESAAFTMRISHEELCETVTRLQKSGLANELGVVSLWQDRNTPLTDAERQANRRARMKGVTNVTKSHDAQRDTVTLEQNRQEKKREEQTDARERGAASPVVSSASLDERPKTHLLTRSLLEGEGYKAEEIDRAILQVDANRNGKQITSYTAYVRGVIDKNRVNPPPWSEEAMPMVQLTQKDLENIRRGRGEM